MNLTPALERAAKELEAADSIGVVCHVGPDGDAIGSALGLAVAAKAAGKSVVVSFGEPFVVPKQFSFLPLDLLVKPGDFPEGLDVVVSCDAAVAERLGNLAPKANSADTLIVIDHHASNVGFGDVEIIDPEAAATAQLVAMLLRHVDWPITKDVATCLYTGLVTDTGRFQYSNTKSEVLHLAADLLAAGVQPELIGQRVYEEVPFGYLSVAAAVMSRATLDPSLGLISSTLYKADLEAVGLLYEEADGLIDLIRVAKEAGVACLLREVDAGTKGSLRSRGVIDVGAIAALLGGGGHHNAAGFMIPKPPDAAYLDVVDAVRQLS